MSDGVHGSLSTQARNNSAFLQTARDDVIAIKHLDVIYGSTVL